MATGCPAASQKADQRPRTKGLGSGPSTSVNLRSVMQPLNRLRDLGDELSQAAKQRRLRQSRRARHATFLCPLRFELLEQRNLLAADFGDAPAPYPTLLFENGARHEATGPRLGMARDSEADGAHSGKANSDGADEDGVTFGRLRAGELNATLTVNIQAAAARLDAWIDFNGDGNWGGPGERIFASRSVTIGDNHLTFDVPSWAKVGTTFARFRVSTAGGVGPKGIAPDGEVEDYLVATNPPLPASAAFESERLIASLADSVSSVYAADMDGDGDMDALSASEQGDVAWYENQGGSFLEHSILSLPGGTEPDPFGGAAVQAADIDGDGDLDVVSASSINDQVAWYENDGSQSFAERVVSLAVDGVRSVVAADVDGDGDVDFLCASGIANKIVWYENNGSESFTERIISTAALGPVSVFAADVDRDGDMDALSASTFDNKIAWYENDGAESFTSHTISTGAVGAVSVFASDVDGDGDLDVLSASHNILPDVPSDDEIAWFENDGSQNFTERLISTTAFGASSVFAADVDGDGDIDALSASRYNGGIIWYENDGSQVFAAHKISNVTFGVRAVFVADVDGDGDVDVLSASATDDKLAWYRNDTHAEFNLLPVSTTNDGVDSVIAADLDGDGDLDLVSGSYQFDSLVPVGPLNWYENIGSQEFVARTISTANNGYQSVFAVDVEGDGDVDVLAATFFGIAIKWFENDGNGSFSERTVAPQRASSIVATDIDGDGDIDVAAADSFDNKVAWYENDGSQIFTERTISTAVSGAYSVLATDLDGDGDVDVLSSSAFDDTIAWYENDGSQVFTKRTISTAADGATSVFATDLDGDGDIDVLSSSANDDKIAWYQNNGSQTFTERAITTAANGASSVFAADVNGDGHTDVLSASAEDDKIAWYQNNGSQSFTERTLSTAADGASSVFAADVDGDGDTDILSASKRDDTIVWYQNLNFDFGDAPAPYQTLASENGARHTSFGPALGTSRSQSLNGTHSPLSNADTDEDGVEAGVLQAGALQAIAIVTVQGGPARLDAWVDFNGDGVWSGPGEQIFSAYPVSSGMNDLSFAVPSDARQGTTFARFRLSTAGGLGPVGEAFDGEVEDYAVLITPPAVGSRVFGGQRTVSAAASFATAVFAADMDGDGDLDVLSASRNDNKIAWYENDGNENYLPHTISTAATGAYSVFAVDVDGDGDLDILSASLSDDKIAWYENDGNQSFAARTISSTARGALSVSAADVDGDGDIDILSASSVDDRITWYDNNGNQSFTARTISASANGAASVVTADVDGDGDLDVLSASVLDDKIAWYENNGSQNFTAHTIATSDGVRSIATTDLDLDGDLDVVSASTFDDKIAWYENDGSQNFTPYTITTSANGAWSVRAADLDGDGDVDVLSASIYDGKIAWYENNGSQSFSARTVSTSAAGARSVFVADADGDGDLDVLSASANDHKIAWYAHDAAPILSANVSATVVEGDRVTIRNTKLSYSDSDNTPAQLVYTVTTLPSHGQLELTTAPGVAITSFTQSQIDANQLRFQHDGSETTSDSFTFTIGDGVVSGVTGGTFHLSVTPASGAPALNTVLNPTLTTINEDAKTPGSTLISSLIQGAVTDPDAGALRGIAITTASNFNGVWQYSLNNGGTWTGMGAPSASKARLLPSSARMRFLPKLNFNGEVKLFYRAWDQTAGTAGGTLPVIGNRGGAKSLSFAQESAKLTVKPVNDKPVLTDISGSMGYVRNAATAIVLAPFGRVTDVDSANFSGGRLRVRITDGASSTNRLAIGAGFTVDAQGNVKQGTTIIGKRVANGFGTNELIVTFNTSATKAIVQQLVRAITFKTVSGAAGQRKAVFTVSDGDGGLSGEVSKTVNVT